MSQDLPPIDELLSATLRVGASDLHLKSGLPPMWRIDGKLQTTRYPMLSRDDTERYLNDLIPDRLRVAFKETSEADFSYGDTVKGRFRVNAFRQRGTIGVALRALLPPTKNFDELGLPAAMQYLTSLQRGLVLVTGPTGSGKSTTLSALVDSINSTRRVNIITIEDPIEVVHPDKLAMVSQREVGLDTANFSEALRRALRQDPDVILIGEMRDVETVDSALKAAETGHLVLSTLHTLDTTETVNRILDMFPAEKQQQIRLLLAGVLRAVVSQRLIPKVGGEGRIPAVEVLVNTPRVADRILDPEQTHTLADVVAEGEYYGMMTFDQSIARLIQAGHIGVEDGMAHATNPADLKLTLQRLGILAS